LVLFLSINYPGIVKDVFAGLDLVAKIVEIKDESGELIIKPIEVFVNRDSLFRRLTLRGRVDEVFSFKYWKSCAKHLLLSHQAGSQQNISRLLREGIDLEPVVVASMRKREVLMEIFDLEIL
jgi:hypothetical protein